MSTTDYPVNPEQFFIPDCDKLPGKLYWWFQDKSEFKTWEKLNSLTHEELEKEQELVDLLVKKYGHIYLFPSHDHARIYHYYCHHAQFLYEHQRLIWVLGSSKGEKSRYVRIS